MKNILLVSAILLATISGAQVTKVELQASGLTCSMCSNAINKALKTVSFIDNIQTDIKRYTFSLTFKPGAAVDFNIIKNKVEAAGFSVSGFLATIQFSNVLLKENEPVTIGHHRLLFVNTTEHSLNGIRQVRILDKGFVSPKEFKSKPYLPLPTDADVFHVAL